MRYLQGVFINFSITARVGGLLLFYSIGFIPSLLNNVFNQVLYAYDKMKTAMINNVVALTSNIILNIFMSKMIGINGIAISTTISSVIGALLCFVSVKKVLPQSKESISCSNWIKVFVSVLASLLVLVFLKHYLLFNRFFSVAYACVCIAIYFALLLLLKNSDVKEAFQKYITRLES